MFQKSDKIDYDYTLITLIMYCERDINLDIKAIRIFVCSSVLPYFPSDSKLA